MTTKELIAELRGHTLLMQSLQGRSYVTVDMAACRLEAIVRAADQYRIELESPVRDPIMMHQRRIELFFAITGDGQ